MILASVVQSINTNSLHHVGSSEQVEKQNKKQKKQDQEQNLFF